MSQSNRLLGKSSNKDTSPKVGAKKTLPSGKRVMWNGRKWIPFVRPSNSNRTSSNSNSSLQRSTNRITGSNTRRRSLSTSSSSKPSQSGSSESAASLARKQGLANNQRAAGMFADLRGSQSKKATTNPSTKPSGGSTTKPKKDKGKQDYGSTNKNVAAWATANKKMINESGTAKQREILRRVESGKSARKSKEDTKSTRTSTGGSRIANITLPKKSNSSLRQAQQQTGQAQLDKLRRSQG